MLSSFFVFGCSTINPSSIKSTATTSCSDSDGGLNYDVKGTVTFDGYTVWPPDKAGGNTHTDSCYPSDPGELIPNSCVFSESLVCGDYRVSTSSINLILQNIAGRDMIISSIAVSSESVERGNCSFKGAVTLANNASHDFKISGCDYKATGRAKDVYRLTLSYLFADSQVQRSMSGQLSATPLGHVVIIKDLAEYYCSNNSLRVAPYTCPNKCSDGACIS